VNRLHGDHSLSILEEIERANAWTRLDHLDGRVVSELLACPGCRDQTDGEITRGVVAEPDHP